MYKIVKITFAGTDGALADAESLKQKAEDFLNALVNSGQIMEEYLLLWREGILSAMVSIPWKDALDDRYASEYVRQNAEGLSIRCEVVPRPAPARILPGICWIWAAITFRPPCIAATAGKRSLSAKSLIWISQAIIIA